MKSLSQVLLDDVDDFLGPGADFMIVAAFEHHAQQRFGARIADQQAALALWTRASTSAMAAATAGTDCRSTFSRTRTFRSTCGKFVRSDARSASVRPVRAIVRSTFSEVHRPSPVYR